jgi:beta-galactosidase
MYVGFHSVDGKAEEMLLRKFYSQNNTKILNLPDYVFVEWRDGYWVAVNYSSSMFELSIVNNQRILIGNQSLESGKVTVW